MFFTGFNKTAGDVIDLAKWKNDKGPLKVQERIRRGKWGRSRKSINIPFWVPGLVVGGAVGLGAHIEHNRQMRIRKLEKKKRK